MLFVILPAFNEARALEQLLPNMIGVLQTFPYRILVVDDGSTDETGKVVSRFKDQGVTLIVHERNQGLGEALRTGFQAAIRESEEADVVITMDADDTHPPELIPAMLEKLASGLDLVVASRFEPGGQEVGLSLYRKVLSRGAGFLMKAFFSLAGVQDYSSGYRAFRASFLARGLSEYGPHLIESGGFAVSVEILLKLSFLGPHCGEVPLVLRYDRKLGKSKMPVIKTIFGYIGLILKLKRGVVLNPEVEA